MNLQSRNISGVRWFVGFSIYVILMSAAALWASSTGRIPLKNLILFVIFVSFACQFCPLPIIPAFLAISRAHNPFLIALLGSMATSIANLHDYYILNSLLNLERLKRVRDSHWYKRASAWFSKYPFLTLSASNFIVPPVDVPRLLAISTGYSRVPFTLATFLGRYPRYLILSYLGYELKLSNKAIIIILAVTLLIALIKYLPKMRERMRGKRCIASGDDAGGNRGGG